MLISTLFSRSNFLVKPGFPNSMLIFFIGLCSTVIPSDSFFTVYFLIFSFFFLLYTQKTPAEKFFVITLGILAGINLFDPFLILSVLCTTSLLPLYKRASGCIIILALSPVQTVNAYFAQWLYGWNLEEFSVLFICGIVLLLFFPKKFIGIFFSIALSTILGIILKKAQLDGTYFLICLCTLLLSISIFFNKENDFGINSKFVFCLGVIFLIADFFWIQPSIPQGLYFYVNKHDGYFKNYAKSIHFSGLNLKELSSFDSIPDESTILFPDISINSYDQKTLNTIKKYSIEKKCSLVFVVDHNNMGKVKEKILSITNLDLVNDDLLVPAHNTDQTGLIRTSMIKGWKTNSLFNRGASPKVPHFFSQILLSGDRWWLENNFVKDAWVGDFIHQPEERSGRIPLIVRTVGKYGAYTVVGDSSPFLNSFVLSNPEPVLQILAMSTGYPLLIKDAVLVFLFIFFGWLKNKRNSIILLLGLVGVALVLSVPPNWFGKSHLYSKIESPFDYRSFNSHLVESAKILDSGWHIKLQKHIDGNLKYEDKTVLFTHIRGKLLYGTINIHSCRRVGSLSYQNAYLMDAQSCVFNGDFKVLIGDKNTVSALRIKDMIIILDQNFLSGNAPPSNKDMLEKWIEN